MNDITDGQATQPRTKAKQIAERIRECIREFNLENGSNTPDWILAKYLLDSLAAAEALIGRRDTWYKIKPGPGWTTYLQDPLTPPATGHGCASGSPTIVISAADPVASRPVFRTVPELVQEVEQLRTANELQADQLTRETQAKQLLEQELRSIDLALGNRSAFDALATRTQKIEKAIQEAGRADRLSHELRQAHVLMQDLERRLAAYRG
jgi:hypothetical protein